MSSLSYVLVTHKIGRFFLFYKLLKFQNKLLFKGAGKLADNPANRKLIQNISNGKALGVDAFGKSWYTGFDAAGKSIYSYGQNGIIKGAGYMNKTPAEMIIKYGLK